MGLNEDLGDRENVGNASLGSFRSRERLIEEIMSDPGNTLFGKPLSEIQKMIYREESLGSPDRDLLFRALELCNESRDRLTRFSMPVEGWLEEARYERDNQ
jgi:hypothetical protein